MSSIVELRRIVDHLSEEYTKDEWVIARFVESHINSLKEEDAYDVVSSIVQLILDSDIENGMPELFTVLLSSARRSNTTEPPPHLIENWDELKLAAEKSGPYVIGLFEEIARYYRIGE